MGDQDVDVPVRGLFGGWERRAHVGEEFAEERDVVVSELVI